MKLKSHLIYKKEQRREIVILLTIIAAGLVAFKLVNFSTEPILDTSSPEIVALQREIDSIKKNQAEQKQKAKPFNPNYITDFKGNALGMSVHEIDRLVAYRAAGKWVNSAEQFKEVTGISDSLLAVISPLFKFPEWVENPKRKNFNSRYSSQKKTQLAKIDLNEATAEELQQVRGIGKVFSERIINYRNQLGGFSDDNQLLNVYGMEPEVVERIKELFTVKTPKEIIVINVNRASASDLATIPGVSYELAKKIWEFRKLRGTIDNLEDLQKVPGISESKFKQIQLYLSIE
ncbi:MAG TPA: helix-hairpin-helix domain-containing protein [Flavobacteriaceae bacterium]|nr:helix-hairpin-helix domain-containing protein [Flavobacteriaceae bacterium]